MEKSVLSIFALFLALVMLTACGAHPTVEALSADDSALETGQSSVNKIIGQNDLLQVLPDGSNVDAILRSKLDAMGLLYIEATPTNGGAGACTATHLGNGYVITAGHCFFNESALGNQIEINKACAEMKVYWGYRGTQGGVASATNRPKVALVSQCLNVLYAERSAGRDFGLFKVDQAPAASIALSQDTKRPAANIKITIFGFPNGQPLEWSKYCPLLKGTATNGANSSAMFAYQCDTEPGNSGSAVLAVSTAGAVKIVGIHDGAASDGVNYNFATYTYDAKQTLLAKGIDLDSLLR